MWPNYGGPNGGIPSWLHNLLRRCGNHNTPYPSEKGIASFLLTSILLQQLLLLHSLQQLLHHLRHFDLLVNPLLNLCMPFGRNWHLES